MISIKKDFNNIPNMLPNVLLTSPVFGIDDLRHTENKKVEEVRGGLNFIFLSP